MIWEYLFFKGFFAGTDPEINNRETLDGVRGKSIWVKKSKLDNPGEAWGRGWHTAAAGARGDRTMRGLPDAAPRHTLRGRGDVVRNSLWHANPEGGPLPAFPQTNNQSRERHVTPSPRRQKSESESEREEIVRGKTHTFARGSVAGKGPLGGTRPRGVQLRSDKSS